MKEETLKQAQIDYYENILEGMFRNQVDQEKELSSLRDQLASARFDHEQSENLNLIRQSTIDSLNKVNAHLKEVNFDLRHTLSQMNELLIEFLGIVNKLTKTKSFKGGFPQTCSSLESLIKKANSLT